MPFKSEKQRRYLWANEPEIARDWTDTYGHRTRADNGGIMDMASDGNLNHEFENYIDRGNVSVPRSFQARSHSTPVNLAYITDKEANILQDLKPGTPHRGPMEIPNYDDYDPSAGRYGRATTGQQMSAMETGGGQTEQNRVDQRALGYTPQQVADIRGGAQQAAAMGQRGSGIGGFFKGLGKGVGNLAMMFNPWTAAAGIMGNPKTAMFMNMLGRGKNRLQNLRQVDGQVMGQDYWSDENRYRRQMEAWRNRFKPADASGLFKGEQISEDLTPDTSMYGGGDEGITPYDEMTGEVDEGIDPNMDPMTLASIKDMNPRQLVEWRKLDTLDKMNKSGVGERELTPEEEQKLEFLRRLRQSGMTSSTGTEIV